MGRAIKDDTMGHEVDDIPCHSFFKLFLLSFLSLLGLGISTVMEQRITDHIFESFIFWCIHLQQAILSNLP